MQSHVHVHARTYIHAKAGKVILLKPAEVLDSPLSEEDRQWIRCNGGEETTHTVSLDYSHFSNYAILRAVLPLELKEVPTGFEPVGHIAHFNLRKEYLPFKEVIGELQTTSRALGVGYTHGTKWS